MIAFRQAFHSDSPLQTRFRTQFCLGAECTEYRTLRHILEENYAVIESFTSSEQAHWRAQYPISMHAQEHFEHAAAEAAPKADRPSATSVTLQRRL